MHPTIHASIHFIVTLLNAHATVVMSGEHINDRMLARACAQVIYDTPTIFSGLATKNAIMNKLQQSAYRPCAEHYNVRQHCGEHLVRLVYSLIETPRDITPEVASLVIDCCRVHYTTKEENSRLRGLQSAYGAGAYEVAGIQLYESADLFTRKGRKSAEWTHKMQERFDLLFH